MEGIDGAIRAMLDDVGVPHRTYVSKSGFKACQKRMISDVLEAGFQSDAGSTGLVALVTGSNLLRNLRLSDHVQAVAIMLSRTNGIVFVNLAVEDMQFGVRSLRVKLEKEHLEKAPSNDCMTCYEPVGACHLQCRSCWVRLCNRCVAMSALFKPRSAMHVCPACKHEEPFMQSLESMERVESACHPDCISAIKAVVHRVPGKRATLVFMSSEGEAETAFAEIFHTPGDARRGVRRGSLVMHANGRISLDDPSVKILVGQLPSPRARPATLTEGTLIEMDSRGRAREIEHLFAPYSVVAAQTLSCDRDADFEDADFEDEYSSEEEYVTDEDLDDPIPEPLPEQAADAVPVPG